MYEWPHDETRPVDHVIGAFYLIRREVFERLGGFDERFFVYLEDLDLSKRIRDLGGRCMFIADAHALHVGGGTTESVKATRLFYSLRSRLQYVSKHHGAIAVVCVGVATLVLEPVIRLGAGLLGRSWMDVKEVARAYARLYGWIVR